MIVPEVDCGHSSILFVVVQDRPVVVTDTPFSPKKKEAAPIQSLSQINPPLQR